MQEMFKLKYLKLCSNEDLFYEIMNDWNCYLLRNPDSKKEDKLKKLESIKEQEPKLYEAMKEDINNGL